jgi:hypothetical protein
MKEINPKWFYRKGEEAKINWFAFEYALEYFDTIYRGSELKAYKKQHTREEVARFCAYFARRMKRSILDKNEGITKQVAFHDGYVADYYLDNTDRQNTELLKVALKAWQNLLIGCSTCPNQCLLNCFEYIPLFESYEKSGLI